MLRCISNPSRRLPQPSRQSCTTSIKLLRGTSGPAKAASRARNPQRGCLRVAKVSRLPFYTSGENPRSLARSPMQLQGRSGEERGRPPAPPRPQVPPRRPQPLHSPHLLVLVDDVGGDLLADDLPEDGVPAGTRRLRLADLVSHGGGSRAAPAGPKARPPRGHAPLGAHWANAGSLPCPPG